MQNNIKLEKLAIEDSNISPIVSSVLCEGLTTENQNLTELSFLRVDFCEASSDQPFAADAVSHLLSGLQNNKTLKRFSLNGCSFVSDCGDSRIIKALEGHPTLEHLKFSEFSIWRYNSQHNYTRESLSAILRNLWKIPNLTHLDLSGNDISKFPDLDASVFEKYRQSRLRSLDLCGNPIMGVSNEEDRSSLLQLVMNAPQLGSIANPYSTETSKLVTPLIRHYLDWNRFGRVRTTDHEKALPLSVWPLVFAIANEILLEERNQLDQTGISDTADRRPNVIYQLFHGFLSLHFGVLSMGIESQLDNHDAAELKDKRQRLL
jgi:hypothetical protein